jgi:molecular chaperone GrpE
MSDEKKKSSSAKASPSTEASASAKATADRPGDRTDDKEESIEELKEKCEEYLVGWKRAKADYENLQKETEQNKKEYADWAKEECLLRLLPAIDQYEVALHFTPELDLQSEKDQKIFDNWMIGLEAVRSLWQEAAKDLGLEKIPVKGKLDPEIHEAVGEEKSEDVPEGEIIRVTVNGYKIGDKVIRCAKVIISKP